MKTIQEMARESQLPYFYQTGETANLKQLEAFAALVREDAQRKPLTDEQIESIIVEMNGNEPTAPFWRDLARAIEAAHGITAATQLKE